MKQASKRNFEAIEGIRAIFSLWIVSLHICITMKWLFYAGYPARPDNLSQLSSPWAIFAQGQGVQVDVFFMLSGFLLINNLLEADKGYVTDSPSRDLIMMLVRRLLRLWPALFVTIGLTCWLRDYHDDWWTLLKTLTFPINPDQPIAFMVNWSSRVDIQCSVVLFTVFYILKSTKMLSFASSCFVAILSMLPKFYNFFFRRALVSYVSLKMTTDDNRYLPVMMNEGRQNYYVSQGMELSFVHDTNDLLRNILAHDYLVFYQRITPFFIGMALAMALREFVIEKNNKGDDNNSSSVELNNKAVAVNSIWHHLWFPLATLITLSPALLALVVKDKPGVSLPTGEFPPFVLDLFFSVIYRSFYAWAIAYFMYRCLLPHDHPLYLQTVSKLLSSWPLKNLGIYSYGIYTIHMRIMMEVVLNILPLSVLDTIFGTEAVFIKFSLWFSLIYTLSLGISLFTHHCVEVPFDRFLTRNYLKCLQLLLYKTSSSSPTPTCSLKPKPE